MIWISNCSIKQIPLLHVDVSVGPSAQTITDGVFLPTEEAT